ncbi:site-specific integrase [Frankia sp. CiP3]|uniref:tyrosine-type recombinase/integrase n=1 Tax=Frankia sp. CiP3 TaxID=2880971 RepID=UPI001EF537DA|nr:site-specific integrase [Frankia sp. CiP3]
MASCPSVDPAGWSEAFEAFTTSLDHRFCRVESRLRLRRFLRGMMAGLQPPGGTSKGRRQPYVGPFDTQKECKDALADALGQGGQTGRDIDRKTKVGEYLDRRLAWRESEAETGDGLARSTLAAEREAIMLYLKPGLGHLRLVELRDAHVRDLYAAMRQINRSEGEGKPPELLRRLLAARAAQGGRRISTRPLSEARIRRIHAVLTGALNDAVTVSKIIDVNPADGVLTTKGGGRKGRARPLLWTAERTAHREQTGKIPAKVMVWSPAQCGAFLDVVEHDRLYALWHLAAFWGLRRGELVGLAWPDVSLDTRRVHVRQAQPDDTLGAVKSEESNRIIIVDETTAAVGRAWRTAQRAERLAWGEAWTDSGRVFTYENGQPLKPAYVSQRFDLLVDRYTALRRRSAAGWSVERIARKHRTSIDTVRVALAGPPLPPVRFHDLRHGAATMLQIGSVVSDATFDSFCDCAAAACFTPARSAGALSLQPPELR